jgi:hypothetical protein
MLFKNSLGEEFRSGRSPTEEIFDCAFDEIISIENHGCGIRLWLQ